MESTPEKNISSLEVEPKEAGSASFGNRGNDHSPDAANASRDGTSVEQSPAVMPGPAGSAAASTKDASLSIELASISDAPTIDDEIGFKPYVTAIARFLLSDQTSGPLTLSIEGEWGSGKSSFMRQLEKELAAPSPELLAPGQRPPATRTFWFNAWRQDKQEAVWAAFALAFGRELRAKNLHKLTSGLRFAYQRAKSNPDLSGLASASIKAMAWIVGIVFCFAALHSLGANWLKWFLTATVASTALVQGFKGMKEVVGNPFETHITQYLRGPDYTQRVAFIEQFHEDFQRMLDTYARDVQKIFVFIDDVDRCEVPKAAELMQAFNLLIGDDKRLVFIIGMDREKVAAGIAAKYKDLTPFLDGNDANSRVDYGFSYLEKFIQLSFLIPPANIDRLDKFFEKMSTPQRAVQRATPDPGNSTATTVTAEAATRPMPAPPPPSPVQQKVERDLEFTGDSARVRDVAKMFAATVHRSPRRLKQFLNLFRLKAHIANQLALFDDDQNDRQKLTFEQLGKFVAISLTWPKLIGKLCANPQLLAYLENDAVAAHVPASAKTEGVADSFSSAKSAIANAAADSAQLTSLLQYGCVEKPGWPFEITLYSLQSVDLAPMLEISPQVVREPRGIHNPKFPTTAPMETVETAASESTELEGGFTTENTDPLEPLQTVPGDSVEFTVFDAVADFSVDQNPNGPWQYGYSRTLNGPFELHKTRLTDILQGRAEKWSSPELGPDIGVTHNKTGSTFRDGLTHDIPHDAIHMHPGEKGIIDVVRWTCPQTGKYSIVGEFRGLDVGAAADVDVHVMKNMEVELASSVLFGAGGTPSQMPFALNQDLRKGDTLDFIVGVGPSGSHGSDSTGLRVTINRNVS